MSAELEALCAGLAGEGTTEAAALGFTLESAKAREKLQEFALAQPENFQLLALAGLCALGSRHFKVTIDADDFAISADHPLNRQPFEDLWTFVSRGGVDCQVIGFRLLAMALLTSVRLGEMEWSVESTDGAGAWRHEATVRRGLLTEKKPFALPTAGQGVLLHAKRKALGQVARRFLTRWLSGASKTGTGGADEALLKERLFLPAGSSLECNGHQLTTGDQSARGVLAVLCTGDAPSMVACPVIHKLDRYYTLTVLLCEPESHNDPALPGLANHTTWIWNGLRMDSTVLGAELDCMRAFVWAPELRPDLSFTTLADNRDKQSLERTVRAQARELLDRWVREFSAQIQAAPVSMSEPLSALTAPFQGRFAIVRNAIRERIDTRKDWRRFASLNRALLEFPLVLGSGPDGRRRWISMAEILGELQDGRPVAAFSGDSEAEDVPAWPDRPLVLYTERADVDFLRLRFSQYELTSGREVLSRVRDRLNSTKLTLQRQPVSSTPALSGQVKLGESPVEWRFDRPQAGSSQPGQLWVHSANGGAFCDESLGLPCGLFARTEAEWRQSYSGALLDRTLASQAKRTLMSALVQAIAARTAPPDAEGCALSGAVLGALKEAGELDGAAQDVAWLVVRTLGGEVRWTTPRDLGTKLDALEAPLYAAEWSYTPPVGLPMEWAELPVALVPKTSKPGLTRLLGRRRVSVQGFERFLEQPTAPAWKSEDLLWTGVLEGEQAILVDCGLRSLTLGILRTVLEDGQAEVEESLFGRCIRKSSYAGIPATCRMAVDWAYGWPDSNGDERSESNGRATRLKKGYLALLRRFFVEVSAPLLRKANPQVVGALMFEVLADEAAASLPLFLLGDGRRVSLSEVPSAQGQVRYFSDLSGATPADAVYLPGPMPEAIGLVSELRWVAVGHEARRETQPAAEPVPIAKKPSPNAVKPTPPVAKPAPRGAPPVKAAKASPALPVQAESAEVEPQPERRTSSSSSSAPPIVEPGAAPPPEREKPAISAEAPEPALSSVVESQRQTSPASPLEVELAELPLDSQPEWGNGFAAFVAASRLALSQKEALRLDGDCAVLGKPCEKALKTSHGRRILLYTLFSIYRRETGTVGPAEARRLHQAILSTSIGARSRPTGQERAQGDRATLE